MQAWALGKLFAAAVDASSDGPVTSTAVKRRLCALRNETPGGLSGLLTSSRASPRRETAT
jgi:hypothetical protein